MKSFKESNDALVIVMGFSSQLFTTFCNNRIAGKSTRERNVVQCIVFGNIYSTLSGWINVESYYILLPREGVSTTAFQVKPPLYFQESCHKRLKSNQWTEDCVFVMLSMLTSKIIEKNWSNQTRINHKLNKMYISTFAELKQLC